MSVRFDEDRVCARYVLERAAPSCRDTAASAATLRSSIALYWQGEDADLFSAAMKAWREETLALAEEMERLGGELLLAVDAAEQEALEESRARAASAAAKSRESSSAAIKAASAAKKAAAAAASVRKAAPSAGNKTAASGLSSAAKAASAAVQRGSPAASSGAAAAANRAAQALAALLGKK